MSFFAIWSHDPLLDSAKLQYSALKSAASAPVRFTCPVGERTPARLDIVIRDRCCMGMLDMSVTVNRFAWHGYGVRCPISFFRKEGARIFNGAASPTSRSHTESPLLQGFGGTLTTSCSTVQTSRNSRCLINNSIFGALWETAGLVTLKQIWYSVPGSVSSSRNNSTRPVVNQICHEVSLHTEGLQTGPNKFTNYLDECKYINGEI